MKEEAKPAARSDLQPAAASASAAAVATSDPGGGGKEGGGKEGGGKEGSHSELEIQLGKVERKLRLDRLYSSRKPSVQPRVYY